MKNLSLKGLMAIGYISFLLEALLVAARSGRIITIGVLTTAAISIGVALLTISYKYLDNEK